VDHDRRGVRGEHRTRQLVVFVTRGV
jgi:hypothetical protein